MVRRIIAGILLLLVGCLITLLVIGAFIPEGRRILPFTTLFATPTPPRPVLTPKGPPPATKAMSAYLLDADSGNELANINGQKQLPMASTTKIMTAIITIEKGNLDQVVTIGQDAVDEAKNNNGSNAQLVVGDKIRLKDLLYGLMLPSGDDAAVAIANTVAGSPTNFVALMNTYARQLHLTQTHYINPDGLTYMTEGKPDPNQYTTAADLARLTRYALANPLFAQIVQLQSYNLPASGVHHRYTWATTDLLLSSYPGATGVKTGSTIEAGYCLVFAATSGGHHLIGAFLNDGEDPNQRFIDARAWLDWGFALPMLPPTPIVVS